MVLAIKGTAVTICGILLCAGIGANWSPASEIFCVSLKRAIRIQYTSIHCNICREDCLCRQILCNIPCAYLLITVHQSCKPVQLTCIADFVNSFFRAVIVDVIFVICFSGRLIYGCIAFRAVTETVAVESYFNILMLTLFHGKFKLMRQSISVAGCFTGVSVASCRHCLWDRICIRSTFQFRIPIIPFISNLITCCCRFCIHL